MDYPRSVITSLRLVPALEFEPYDWCPDGYSDALGTNEWPSYWAGVLRPLGLSPVRPGSCFVPADQCRDGSLIEQLVRRVIEGSGIEGFPDEDDDTDTDEERLTALIGGVALVADGEVMLEPGCCCDLGDLEEWRTTLAKLESDWAYLPIGHWTTSVRLDGEAVVVMESPESGAPAVEFRVSRVAFEAGFPGAEAVLGAFEQRLVPVLAGLVGDPERAARIAKILAGSSRCVRRPI